MNVLYLLFYFLSHDVYPEGTNRVGHNWQTRYQKAGTSENFFLLYLLQKLKTSHIFPFITSIAILIKKLSFKLKDDKLIASSDIKSDLHKQAQLMFYNL